MAWVSPLTGSGIRLPPATTAARARDDGGDEVVERHGYLRLLVDEAPLPRYDEVLRDAATQATSAVELEQLHAEHELALQLRDLMERQRVRHEQQRALVECAKELADVRTDPIGS